MKESIDNLFILTRSDYEEYNVIYLKGPSNLSQEDFNLLCLDFMPEAEILAIKNEKNKEYPSFVGGYEIINALASIFETKGFIRIEPKKS